MADFKPELHCTSGMECDINDIPTPTSTFSAILNSSVTLSTSPTAEIQKMADFKPEVPLSLERSEISTKFKRLANISDMLYSTVTLPTFLDVGRLPKFKMADCKSEVHCIYVME